MSHLVPCSSTLGFPLHFSFSYLLPFIPFLLLLSLSQIGFVGQDPLLFSGSIMDNLLLGSPNATREQVMEASRLCLADEFICKLPKGYETPLGGQGLDMLSGGALMMMMFCCVVTP